MTPIYSNSTLSPFPTTVESSTVTDHDHSDHGDLDQVIQQHHHHYHQHLLFSSTSPTSSSSLTSFPSIFFNNPIQDHVGNFGRDHEDHQLEVMNKYVLHGGSSSNDHQPHQFFPSHDDSSHPTLESTITSSTMVDHQETNNYGSDLKLSIYEQEEEEVVDEEEEEEEDNKDHDDNDYKHMEIGSSVKWMSSKMRLMKKMMNKPNKFDQSSAYSPPSNKDNNNNTIRVCADCNTTKTPLWRSGPRGPKSLCNACGIRQRKARRAMAAAAAATNDDKVVGVANDRKETISSSTPKNNKIKIKNSSTATVTTAIPAATTTTESGCTNDNMMPYKKRCKIVGPSSNYDNNNNSRKKLCFEDLTISLMSNSSLDHQQVFPQDEKEAAILLMALSYGLVHG
ncbi:hypothetical protein MKW98_009105 [Papaver atlanticum]|uniref:GATA-type domain-containing protein n=1 Tax=Papaver atlanticum TaxID=357466 RepID=A0AAD4T7F5_9MAGN|nr:hypothetical protein MKW98_009105 [Papaver atlanticum]